MEATRRMADFVLATSLDRIPPQVLNLAKACLLDTVGVTVLGTRTPWGKIITDFARATGAKGSSTVFGVEGQRYQPLAAALANGTCAHGFELDDVHYPSISHPGAVVVPVALSLGEATDVSGKVLLEAVIVGYDVMGRVGASIASSHLAKGFHPTGTFGLFGATAACAKILDLDLEEIQDAFGLAGSLASGIFQFSIGGSMVKRLHAGHAAESGMKAALLAQRGFTGPREILEGKYGFCRVFTDAPEEVDWAKMLDGLGERYAVEEISVKPSPACGVLHAVVDCLRMIDAEKKVAADQIEEIVVSGSENLAYMHNDYQPNSILSAQYSLPFTVGMAVEGKIDDFSAYLDESILRDQGVLTAGAKVKTEIDAAINEAYPDKFGARVAIRFKDGEVIEKSMKNPKGSTDAPFSDEELEMKFRAAAEGTLGKTKADTLIERINSIETLPRARDLLEGIY